MQQEVPLQTVYLFPFYYKLLENPSAEAGKRAAKLLLWRWYQ